MENLLPVQILPYSRIIGQDKLKLALELAYIAPRVGGVLISGQRGTAKSTAVRAFAQMMYDRLPVTLPISATEDRVVGGWKIDELMRGRAREQRGLLEEANGGLLYVDEVNLLEDHIVNIILDVASTGVLVVQREGRRDQRPTSFTLVGTMNPEEGWLRPQLRDRFGLMATVATERAKKVEKEGEKDPRREILQVVLDFDRALFNLRHNQPSDWLAKWRRKDDEHRAAIEKARSALPKVDLPEPIVASCVRLVEAFDAEGHRGDYVLALAARACAAREAALRGGEAAEARVTRAHLREVARLALQHRRPQAEQGQEGLWDPKEDDPRVAKILDQSDA
jgi:magnesium chelatase subunit I